MPATVSAPAQVTAGMHRHPHGPACCAKQHATRGHAGLGYRQSSCEQYTPERDGPRAMTGSEWQQAHCLVAPHPPSQSRPLVNHDCCADRPAIQGFHTPHHHALCVPLLPLGAKQLERGQADVASVHLMHLQCQASAGAEGKARGGLNEW